MIGIVYFASFSHTVFPTDHNACIAKTDAQSSLPVKQVSLQTTAVFYTLIKVKIQILPQRMLLVSFSSANPPNQILCLTARNHPQAYLCKGLEYIPSVKTVYR